ncbi:MAG: hypothetical protein AB7O77_10820 [Phycisphaerales bacterium]
MSTRLQIYALLLCCLAASVAVSAIGGLGEWHTECLATEASQPKEIQIPRVPPILVCRQISQAGAANSSGVAFALWRNGTAVVSCIHMLPGCDLCVVQLSAATVDKILARFEQCGVLRLPADPPGPVGAARIEIMCDFNAKRSQHAYLLSDLARPSNQEAHAVDILVRQCRPAASSILNNSDEWNTAIVHYCRNQQWLP